MIDKQLTEFANKIIAKVIVKLWIEANELAGNKPTDKESDIVFNRFLELFNSIRGEIKETTRVFECVLSDQNKALILSGPYENLNDLMSSSVPMYDNCVALQVSLLNQDVVLIAQSTNDLEWEVLIDPSVPTGLREWGRSVVSANF